ncbi:MAG TPA: DUF4157 domain-containing protein, partial [Candidatus Cybelea sp.]
MRHAISQQPVSRAFLEDRAASEPASAPGVALEHETRSFFEPRFGCDFSQVRVHYGSSAGEAAEAIDAESYTVGEHIVFAPGRYQPQSRGGALLLAHELAHVVQQRRGQCTAGVSEPNDPAEAAADRAATMVTVMPAPRSTNPVAIKNLTQPCHHIQRKIVLSGKTLDSKASDALAHDLLKHELHDISPGTVPQSLVLETVREMDSASNALVFASRDDLATDVRRRVLLSHEMRMSQGSATWRKAFSYPDRASDGTAGVQAKVNDAATSLWSPRQEDAEGHYYFDLSPAGQDNPYAALTALFTEQKDARKRTLIHCDYVLSVLEFRSYAESIGP